MISIAITASIHTVHSSNLEVHKKQSHLSPSNQASSLGAKNVPSNLEGHAHFNFRRKELNQKTNQAKEIDTEHFSPKFSDERWKNGTWDLNKFVKRGKVDWDAVIVAEAKRRRFLELYPEAATKQEPVLFRSSVVPWWAWITHSLLPEAELLNGRAAMAGFFMAYFVDALTRLDVVGQAGNFICKAALLATVLGIVLFRNRQGFGNRQKLAKEATFYNKQWKASWQDQQESGTTTSKEGRTDI